MYTVNPPYGKPELLKGINLYTFNNLPSQSNSLVNSIGTNNEYNLKDSNYT
jgi:hypothetical protein